MPGRIRRRRAAPWGCCCVAVLLLVGGAGAAPGGGPPRLPLLARVVNAAPSSSSSSSSSFATSATATTTSTATTSLASEPQEHDKGGKKASSKKLQQAPPQLEDQDPWNAVKAWTHRIKGGLEDALAQQRSSLTRIARRPVIKPGSKGPPTPVDGEEGHHEHEKEEYSGSRTLRMLEFWGRSMDIYSSYKFNQVRIGLRGALIRDPAEREKQVQAWWDEVHERNSEKMLDLCLGMRGFYLKAGQFLGTRPDFMPLPYILKLSALHDRVPPIPEAHIRQVLEEELGRPIEEVFSFLNLHTPVGSASICQVHEGRLRSHNHEKVAVKIQYPNAEKVMRSDLANLRTLCTYLKQVELKFDLTSVIVELQKQIAQEFDFRKEAHSLTTVGPPLEKAFSFVSVPKPFLATKRLLVMSYLDGTSLARLEEQEVNKRNKQGGGGAGKVHGRKRRALARILTFGLAGRGDPTATVSAMGPGCGGGLLGDSMKRKIGKQLIEKMADAWGYMLFHCDCIQADPHPGNILLMKGLRLGILDWGQTKALDPKLKRQLARLLVAMGKGPGNEEVIKREFYRLGIVTEKEDDAATVSKMVYSMFDTCFIEEFCGNPFDKAHSLNHNAVLSFPSDLCYILRTIQILRGMSTGMGVDFNLTQVWSPMAQNFLDREKEAAKAKEAEVVDFNRKVTI